jgi:probable HAF family extracellular repeat protein
MTAIVRCVQRLGRAVLMLALLSLAAQGTVAADVPFYTVERVASRSGARQWPTGMNNRGQMIGQLTGFSDLWHAFLWTLPDGAQDLGAGGLGEPTDINDAGQVVGSLYTLNHAFIWSASDGLRDLGTLGGDASATYSINNAGQVVGGASTADGSFHAFLWTAAAGMRDLGTLGGKNSALTSINDLGHAVGASQISPPPGTDPAKAPARVVLWAPENGMRALDLPSEYKYSPRAINNADQITGDYTDANGATRAFLWTPGEGMRDLGTLPGTSITYARSINDAGQVVGWSQYMQHAFVYTVATGLVDLNSRIDPGLDLKLFTAPAINQAGQIVVGLGGSDDFVRLTPDTLPPTTAAQLSPEPMATGRSFGEVRVTLSAADNPGGCGGVEITYSATGALTIAPTTVSGPSATVSIAAPGQTNLSFFARDRAGNVESPKAVTVRIGKPVAPQAPSGLSLPVPGAEGVSELDLTWSDRSDNEAGFEIQRKGAGSDWTLITVTPPDATSFTDAGLAPYTHYRYRVRAVNVVGSSAWSNEAASDTGVRPLVQLAPDSLEFDRQPVGTSSPPQTVRLTNAGNGPLVLESILLTGNGRGEFRLLDGARTGTLQPGESRTFQVTFIPEATGSWLAALTIQSSAPDSPHQIALSGAGVPGAGGGPGLKIGVSRLSLPEDVDFGLQWLGAPGAVKRFTLTNTGTALLKIQHITLAGVDAHDFAIVAGGVGGTVAPGASRTLTLRFAPKALGSRSALLTIRSNADGSPHQIALSGTGAVPTDGALGGAVPSPTKVELLIAAIDGVPAHKAVVSPGHCVSLKLRVKYRNGAVAELTDDPNLQFSAAGARGPFTQTNLWCPQPGDAGRTITLVGRYTSPSGRQLLGKLALTVRRATNTHP